MQAMAQGDFRFGGTAPNRTHDARPGLLVHDIRHEISRRWKGISGTAKMRRACAFPWPTDATARPAAMSCFLRLVGDVPIRHAPRFGVSCMREASVGIVGGPSGSRRMQSSRHGSPVSGKIEDTERRPYPCSAIAGVPTISRGSGCRKSAESRMSFASGSRDSFRDVSFRSGGTKCGSTPWHLQPSSCNAGIVFSKPQVPIAAWHGCSDRCHSVESSLIGVAAKSPRIRAVRVHLGNPRPPSQAFISQYVPSMLAIRSDICRSHLLPEAYERLLRHVRGKWLVDQNFVHPPAQQNCDLAWPKSTISVKRSTSGERSSPDDVAGRVRCYLWIDANRKHGDAADASKSQGGCNYPVGRWRSQSI